MTIYTTKTAEFGRVTFTAPASSSDYPGSVWIETETGYASNQPRQICYGGDFSGSAVTATTDSLKSDCQKWLRDRRAWMRKEGL